MSLTCLGSSMIWMYGPWAETHTHVDEVNERQIFPQKSQTVSFFTRLQEVVPRDSALESLVLGWQVEPGYSVWTEHVAAELENIQTVVPEKLLHKGFFWLNLLIVSFTFIINLPAQVQWSGSTKTWGLRCLKPL